MKQLRVLLLPPGWDASRSQGDPQQYVAGTHLYTWVERDNVGYSILSKETTRWQGLGVEPQTFRSEVPRANHYTTAPTTAYKPSEAKFQAIFFPLMGIYTFKMTYLLLTRLSSSAAGAPLPGLHLKHSTEQIIRGCRQEPDLSVRMQTVQVGALSGKNFIDVVVIGFVVGVRRDGKSRCKVHLTFKLQKQKQLASC